MDLEQIKEIWYNRFMQFLIMARNDHTGDLTLIEDREDSAVVSINRNHEDVVDVIGNALTLRYKVLQEGNEVSDEGTIWLQIAGIAIRGIQEGGEYAVNYDTIASLLTKKRIDYGYKNIVAFGQQGIIIRSMDKVFRLQNLLKREGRSEVGESIEDAFVDIVGYCAVAYLYIQNQWSDDTVQTPIIPEPTRVSWVPAKDYKKPEDRSLISTQDGYILIGQWHADLGIWMDDEDTTVHAVQAWAPLPTGILICNLPHPSEKEKR